MISLSRSLWVDNASTNSNVYNVDQKASFKSFRGIANTQITGLEWFSVTVEIILSTCVTWNIQTLGNSVGGNWRDFVQFIILYKNKCQMSCRETQRAEEINIIQMVLELILQCHQMINLELTRPTEMNVHNQDH